MSGVPLQRGETKEEGGRKEEGGMRGEERGESMNEREERRRRETNIDEGLFGDDAVSHSKSPQTLRGKLLERGKTQRGERHNARCETTQQQEQRGIERKENRRQTDRQRNTDIEMSVGLFPVLLDRLRGEAAVQLAVRSFAVHFDQAVARIFHQNRHASSRVREFDRFVQLKFVVGSPNVDHHSRSVDLERTDMKQLGLFVLCVYVERRERE
jgi:hypothetical protein